MEGTNWDVAGVLDTDKTEADFLKRHMADEGTYPDTLPEKKEAALKLAWELCAEQGNAEIPKPNAEAAAPKEGQAGE